MLFFVVNFKIIILRIEVRSDIIFEEEHHTKNQREEKKDMKSKEQKVNKYCL